MLQHPKPERITRSGGGGKTPMLRSNYQMHLLRTNTERTLQKRWRKSPMLWRNHQKRLIENVQWSHTRSTDCNLTPGRIHQKRWRNTHLRGRARSCGAVTLRQESVQKRWLGPNARMIHQKLGISSQSLGVISTSNAGANRWGLPTNGLGVIANAME